MNVRGTSRLHSALALSGAVFLGMALLFGLTAGLARADVGGGGPVAPSATTLYVSAAGGSDANPCSQSEPCATIQHAVDVAADGDTIIVAAQEVQLDTSTFPPSLVTVTNIYTGEGANVVYLTRSLTVEGGYVRLNTGQWIIGLSPTQIDGESARRPLAAEGVTVTLRGLELVNGAADFGGGLYAKDATLKLGLLYIHGNHATQAGGGLYLDGCRASVSTDDLLQGVIRVVENEAPQGGGLYLAGGTPVLSGLVVEGNRAQQGGGGFYLDGGIPLLLAGVVQANAAAQGGGFYLDHTPTRVAGMAVLSNTAEQGGGFYVDGPLGFSRETVPVLANNYVRFNQADDGGAFFFHEAVAGLVNTIVAENHGATGAAFYLYASSPQLFHTTMATNTGASAIYVTHKQGSVWPPVPPLPSYPAFTNTIIVSHSVALYVDSTGFPDPLQNHVTMEGTLWWNNGTEIGGHADLVSREADVEGDPRFTCTGQPPACLKPYHILTDSAAMDAGVPVALTLPGTDLFVDIDLESRPSGKGYDIGADEVISDDYSVWLVPPFESRTITPSGTITFAHQLINSGKETDTYTLTFQSAHGWATLLTPPEVTVGAMQSTTVVVSVTVPADAASGITDTLLITATSHASPDVHGRALDLTRVVSTTDLNLAILKRADRAVFGEGEPIAFTLLVTKTGTVSGTIAVTLIDHTEPYSIVEAVRLPSDCQAVTETGTITCTWSIPGTGELITRELHVVITPTAAFTGYVINTARVQGSQDEVDTTDNLSVAYADVVERLKVYLPLVLKNYP